jgi:hypothetical protein
MTKTMQELNYLGGCLHPKTPEGRAFLHRVYWAHVEELPNYEDREVGLYELAEAAVPVATQEQWMVFADLGGWMVDVDEVMGDEGTPAERMRIALCMVADLLMAGLEAEHIEQEGKVTA